MNFFLIPLAALILLIAFMLFCTLRIQRTPQPVEKIEKLQVDKSIISKHLSQAVQIQTISKPEMVETDYKPFLEIHRWIEKTYPGITGSFEKTVINKYSLLYKWTGKDTRLKPVLLNAHLDVVPVDAKSKADWQVDPFGGEIRDGYVWGRGSLDMKCNLVGILDSVEKLLGEGFTPKRTIYIAFGHDEEVSGFDGSLKIVEHLKSKGVKLAAVLDEGGTVSQGVLAGVEDPIALIGITEKGYLTLRLSTESEPGHSSRPPRQTAVGIISRAVALIDDHPFPANLKHFLPTLQKIAYVLPFKFQLAVANAGILGPVMIRALAGKQDTNALLRTTHAATIMRGGIKDNILPSSAEVKINLRLMPGDTIDGVIERFTRIVDDPRVKIEIDDDRKAWEASEVSSIEGPAYKTLELVVRQIFDDVPTAPFVFLAATDSRHYQPICDSIFKFSPYLITPEGRKGVHGINERISQDELAGMAAFYHRLIALWGEAEF
jgi:carboxypeptidase PM20D1